MPTYEYRCPKGHEFELFQRMSEEPRTPCPECGEEAQRLISGGAGLIFKGDGFYITDYRSEAYKKAASSDKEAASKDTTSGEKSGSTAESGGKSGAGSGSDKASGKSKDSSSGSGSSGASKSPSGAKSSSSDS